MGIGIEINRTAWPGFRGKWWCLLGPILTSFCPGHIHNWIHPPKARVFRHESCCFWLPLITGVVFYGSNVNMQVFLRMGDSRGLLTLGGWGNKKLKRRQRERWTILELFMLLLIGCSIHRGKFREGIRDCESNGKPDPGERL